MKILVISLIMAVIFVGCNSQPNNADDEPADKEIFCSHVNVENIDQTIPFVDVFLSGLSNDLDDEQKLQALATWLKQQPCIIDAAVFFVSCVEADPLQSEILISFEENGEPVEMILEISMCNPLKAKGYHDKPEEVLQGCIEKITAKVENASEYSNVVVVKWIGYDVELNRIVEFARGVWKDDGFTIELPKTLDPKYLGIGTFYLPIETITISNKIKIREAFFTGFDKDGNYVADFFPAKETEDGNIKAFYIYVDSDATISGYITDRAYLLEKDDNGNCIRFWWNINTTFSDKLTKGWNIRYHSKSISRTERTITEQWSTAHVSGMKWYSNKDYEAINIYNNIQADCIGNIF